MKSKPHFVRLVIYALEHAFCLSETELLSQRRPDHVAFARQVGMVALMQQFGFTAHDSACAFCRVCHGTALHAAMAVRKRVRRSELVRLRVAEFTEELDRLRKLSGHQPNQNSDEHDN